VSVPSAIANDDFTETIFELADELGPQRIRDLLVHAGMGLPAAARDRGDANDEPAWERLAEAIERVIAYTSPAYAWKQLRATLEVYDGYGGQEAGPDDKPRRAPADGGEPDLEAPVPLGARYVECPVCGAEAYLVVAFGPASVPGRCARCGAEAPP